MSNNPSPSNAKELLQALADRGAIATADSSIETLIAEQAEESGFPIFLRLLVGVGAFVASIFFLIAFFFATSIRESQYFPLGIVLIAVAYGLYRLGGMAKTLGEIFFIQSSYAVMATGKTMLIIGLMEMTQQEWVIPFGLILISAVTYVPYKAFLDRMLSPYSAGLAVFLWILFGDEINEYRLLAFNGALLVLTAVVAWLLTRESLKRQYVPLVYSLLLSLITAVFFLALGRDFHALESSGSAAIHPWFASILFSLALVGAMAWLQGGIQALKKEPMVWAVVGVAVLGMTTLPGVLLGMTLMVVGYGKHERVLTLLGTLILPIFLFYYYYNVDITLLEKSGLLMASGALLLLGYGFMRYKGWDQGGQV